MISNNTIFLSELKSILKGYNKVTPNIRRRLKKLGFSIVDGKKHCKVYYGADECHPYVMPKTPSDYRVGLNVALGLFSMANTLKLARA